ncbi:hypothetical protein Vafri_7457 [Volvox africanus]|uniref:Uncharacterized protein n=1 Tax=Volvox africanus TaxID=51714 RepID=A0A8J4B246_9CHLO|nr:hypothetical protein Vafri_7457 [Volvox africanus]
MASERGCADLLADLAQQYERSRAFLEQLEGSLQERASSAVVAATSVKFSDLPTPLEAEEPDEETKEEAQEEKATNLLNKALPNAPRKTGGLRAKLSSLFSRSRSTDTDDSREELKPRVSFIDIKGVAMATPAAEPPRFLSFHPMGSNSALHPTSALLRQGPRVSLEASKQQQLEINDGMAPRRLSTSNLGGLQQVPIPRRSIDPFPAAGRRASIEVTANKIRPAMQSNSNFDITAAARLSNGQPSPVGTSPGSGATPRIISSPWHQQQQQSLETYATAPVSSGQLMLMREDSIRRRSISRRASDRPSSPCPSRCASFNTNPQLLGSPAGSPTLSSFLSPGTSLTAGLPALLPTYGLQLGNNSNGGNPSSIFLRPHSMSSVLTVSTGVQDEQPVGFSGLVSPGSDWCAVSATGMVNPVAAAGNGAAISADSVQQLQLPVLPARSRSMHASSISSLVTSSASPRVAAPGMEPRRLQSFRYADTRVCASVSSPGSGARDEEPRQHCSGATSGKQLAPSASGSKFQGTMHLI